MAKFIKMYVTTEDVSKRLSEPYTGKEVVFTDVHIAQDGSVEFTAVLTDDSVEDDANPRRSKFEFEKKSFSEGSPVDLSGVYDLRDREQSEFIGMEASKKCLSDALKKYTYTTGDLLDEVSRILNDENISDEFKDFLAKAIARERNSNDMQQIASTTKSELCSRIECGISALTNLGFDISYDRKTNKLSIKNMEYITELNGESAEQTNRLREKAEKIINNATSDVKEIDDIFGNKND